MNIIASIDTAFRDFKYSLRTLARTPGFTAIAILTIPFFIDLSSRIIVWRPILDEHGLINNFLLATLSSPRRSTGSGTRNGPCTSP